VAKETTFEHPPKGHVGVLGYEDAGDNYVVLAVDANGRLEIVIPIEEALGARAYHYDGAAWRRSNLLWGYHDTASEDVTVSDLSSGTNNLDGTTVPEGEVWVITALAMYYNGTPPTRMDTRPVVGGVAIPALYEDSITSQKWYTLQGNWVLKEDDYVRLTIVGATADDAAILRYGGYKMDITM
jgi:hypothetical protein